MRSINRTKRFVMSKAVALAVLVSFLFTNVAVVGIFADTLTSGKTAANVTATFATDLTQLGRSGRLRENLNFENEVSGLADMLEKGGKRQPIVIDEKGESQDLIVEQLAIRVAKGNVPRSLTGIIVTRLEGSVIFSNSNSNTEVAAKLDAVLNSVESSKSRTVLFVNDISSLLNDGNSRLAKDIAAGTLSVIAGSSAAAYQQNIEKNSNVADLFAPLFVESDQSSTANESAADIRKGGYAGDNLSPDLREMMNQDPSGHKRLDVIVQVADIVRIEAEDNYVRLWADRPYLHKETLTGLVARLSPLTFLRVHRSHAVNVQFVRELRPQLHGEYLIALSDGTELTSGRGFLASIQAMFGLA